MKNIKIKSVGQFMTKLLKSECFDPFEVESLQIKGAYTVNIEGRIHKDFYPADERDGQKGEFMLWKALRPLCYEIIKGKNTPLYISINFHAPMQLLSEVYAGSGTTLMPEDISALLLCVRYDGSGISLVSSSSLRVFTMDKSIDRAWDEKIPSLLAETGLDFDEM